MAMKNNAPSVILALLCIAAGGIVAGGVAGADDAAPIITAGFERQRVNAISNDIGSASLSLSGLTGKNSKFDTDSFWLKTDGSETLHLGLGFEQPLLKGVVHIDVSASASGQGRRGLSFDTLFNETDAFSLGYSRPIFETKQASLQGIFGGTLVRSRSPVADGTRTAINSRSAQLGLQYSSTGGTGDTARSSAASVTLVVSASDSFTEAGALRTGRQTDTTYYIDLNLSHAMPLSAGFKAKLAGDFRLSPDKACSADATIYGHLGHTVPKTGFECVSINAEISHEIPHLFGVLESVEPYVFFDYGDVVSAEGISDIGAGIRFSVGPNVSGQFEYVRGIGGEETLSDNFDFKLSFSF